MATGGNELGPAEEYKTLREELQQAKKYVFERPLLIVAVGVAGLRLGGTDHLPMVPLLVAALLLFNFWFTVNRLKSAGRIVAYIQLELEERKHGQWVGWETCLREYRKWVNCKAENENEGEGQGDPEPDSKAVPDALMYYPPIYQLHIGLMALAATSSILISLRDRGWVSSVCSVLVACLAAWFCVYLGRYSPSRMKTVIEDNRAIWGKVLTKMMIEGLKPSN